MNSGVWDKLAGGHENRHYHNAARILDGNDLSAAVARCPELKALVNTILSVCGAAVIP